MGMTHGSVLLLVDILLLSSLGLLQTRLRGTFLDVFPGTHMEVSLEHVGWGGGTTKGLPGLTLVDENLHLQILSNLIFGNLVSVIVNQRV